MAPKARPRNKTARRPASRVKAAPIQAVPIVTEKAEVPLAWTLAFPILVALGTAAFYRFHSVTGWGLMAAAALTAWKADALAPGSCPRWGAFLWISGFISVLWGFTSIHGVIQFNPFHPAYVPSQALPTAAAGFILFLGAQAWMGTKEGPWDRLGSRVSRFWLLAILILAAYLRLKTWRDPDFRYWFDYALSFMEARTAVDFPSERHLIMPFGSRQTFYLYLVALGYWFFPKVSSLVLLKILWDLMDLLSVWVHYLLGREVGGRRVGLLLAAAMAISKPMTQICLTGEPPITTTLCVGVMLLFAVRFWKKPDIRHALQWGVAVGFGAYGYNTVRPFLWWIPIVMILATLNRTRSSWRPGILSFFFGTAVVWSWFFFKFNGFLPKALVDSGLSSPIVSWGLLLLMVGLFFRLRRNARMNEFQLWDAPALALLTAMVVMAPMVTHPLYGAYISGYSPSNLKQPMHPEGGLTASYLADRLFRVFRELFVEFSDRGDMAMPGEAFFSLTSIPWVFAGLAYAFFKPNRVKFLLLATLGVGLIPHLMSLLSHSGRLLGILAPLFLLGALATDHFIRNLKSGGALRLTAYLLLIAYFGWAIQILDYRTYHVIRENPSGAYLIYMETRKLAPHQRAYIWNDDEWCSTYTLSAMTDSREFFSIDDRGVEVPFLDGTTPPDTAVIFNGKNRPVSQRLQQEFPGAKFDETFFPNQDPQKSPPYLIRCTVPGSVIKSVPPHGPKPLLWSREVPTNSWRILQYAHRDGLGYGFIQSEGWIRDPLGPLPAPQPMLATRAEGSITIPLTGIYRFEVHRTGNFAVVDIDGHRLFNLRPTYPDMISQVREIRLTAGRHPIEILSFLQMGLQLSPISIRFPGEKLDRPLGSF